MRASATVSRPHAATRAANDPDEDRNRQAIRGDADLVHVDAVCGNIGRPDRGDAGTASSQLDGKWTTLLPV